jgi:hypothetical protein
LWEAIEEEPEKLVEQAWRTPLEKLAHFLETARKRGREVEPLWEAIEEEPEKLVEQAWRTPLEKLAHFLETARKRGREVEPLWEAIEEEPEKLVERAWRTPLGDVAHFLETARRHGREVEPLWEAIEEEPERFAEQAFRTPLEHIASFFKEARKQNRQTDPLWEIIESHPEKLSTIAQQSSTNALAAFCRRAPANVIETTLSDFPADHWEKIPASESLVGGTRVASACMEVGREDLKSALITKILRRANQQDFPTNSTALKNIGWLLKNTSSSDRTLIPEFLDEFCKRKWLRKNYMNARCDSLASGLRMLCLHQPPHVYQRFLHVSLDTRLERELLYFNNKNQMRHSHIIQLFGCATLCGRDIPAGRLSRVSLRQIRKLPLDELSHRPDASNVEHYQYQLWLGLRAVALVTGESIQVPADVIDRTLDLWKNNLETTTQEPKSATHHVNQSMVTWLEKCLQENQGLLPSPAPDWPPRVE